MDFGATLWDYTEVQITGRWNSHVCSIPCLFNYSVYMSRTRRWQICHCHWLSKSTSGCRKAECQTVCSAFRHSAQNWAVAVGMPTFGIQPCQLFAWKCIQHSDCLLAIRQQKFYEVTHGRWVTKQTEMPGNRNFRSRERKYHGMELSLPGAKVPRTFAPRNFRSLELLLRSLELLLTG